MTFYQELQLGAAESKLQIKDSKNIKERMYHTAVYLFKVIITILFCIAVITVFTTFFGEENRMAGVVIVLGVMLFRNVSFEIRTSQGVLSLFVILAILTFAPHLANTVSPFAALPIHLLSVAVIVMLGCHNLYTCNQFVVVLSYLLLYGYDVSGQLYIKRIEGMAVGAVVIILIYIFKHRGKYYNRTFKDMFKEYNIRSTRTSWQIKITLAISTLLTIAELVGLPRVMWAGIAVMSVLVPSKKDITKRAANRSLGNIAGGVVFTAFYYLLPDFMLPFIGIFGGMGTSFSATYRWQSMFNSLGAMSMAVVVFGNLRDAVLYRIVDNIIGAVYGILFGLLFHKAAAYIFNKKKDAKAINA